MKLKNRSVTRRILTGAATTATARPRPAPVVAETALRRHGVRYILIGPPNSGKTYTLLSLKKTIDRRMMSGRYDPNIRMDYLSTAFQDQQELAESAGRTERTADDRRCVQDAECIGFTTDAGSILVVADPGEGQLNRGAVDVPNLQARLLARSDGLFATVNPYRHDARVGFWSVCSLTRQFLQSRENLKEIVASFSTPKEMEDLVGSEDRSFWCALLVALHETVGLTPAGLYRLHPAWKRYSMQELNAARIDQNLNATFDLPGRDPFYFVGVPGATGKKLLSDIRHTIRKIVERDSLIDPARALSVSWPREFKVVVTRADIASVTGIPEYHLREIGRRVFPNRHVTDQQVVLVGAKDGRNAATLLDVLANGGVHDRADDLLDAILASQRARPQSPVFRFPWERLGQIRFPLAALAILIPALAAVLLSGSSHSWLVLLFSFLVWLFVFAAWLVGCRHRDEWRPVADLAAALPPVHETVHVRPLADETMLHQATAKPEV